MDTAEVTSGAEIVRRASELAPLFQKHALWEEDNRRLHDESVEALVDAGITRMRIPARHGGHELNLNTTVDVISELGRGSGAVAWTVAVWTISSWVLSLFPDEVQQEVFSPADVRVSGILSPSAIAVPTEGGVILNGRWPFNTGAQQSQWNANAAVLAHPDGEQEPVMVAVPMADLEIIDDWYAAGLKGSGSVTTVAKDVFVPQERVLSMPPVLQGTHPAQVNAASPIYRLPFLPVACVTVSAVALGLARAGREAFFERLPGRKITYTDYGNQSEAPLTHLQTAEASMKVDETEFHVRRSANLLDDRSRRRRPLTLEERARVRLDLGAACLRAKEAVDVYNTASGGSSLYNSVPIQRIERDIQALNLHAIMHPNTNFELYGRVLCGLEPNTLYI